MLHKNPFCCVARSQAGSIFFFFSFYYIHDMVKLYSIGHTLVLNGVLVQIQHARQHFDHINTSGR